MRKNGITGCLENLLAVLSRVDIIDRQAGMTAAEKYRETMQKLADHYEFTLQQTTAAFVALSPNNDYSKNLRSLVTLMMGMRGSRDVNDLTVSTYNACKVRAWEFLKGADFLQVTKGKKTRAFYLNILGDPEPVCVDGHMVSAWHGNPQTMVTVARRGFKYDAVAKDIREAARIHKVLPCQAQGMLWFTWKRINNIVYNGNLDLFRDPWGLEVMPEDILPYD